MRGRDDASDPEESTRLSPRRVVPGPPDVDETVLVDRTEPVDRTELVGRTELVDRTVVSPRTGVPDAAAPSDDTRLSPRQGPTSAPRRTEPIVADAPPAVYRPRAAPEHPERGAQPAPVASADAWDASAIAAHRRRTRVRTLVIVGSLVVLVVGAGAAALAVLLIAS